MKDIGRSALYCSTGKNWDVYVPADESAHREITHTSSGDYLHLERIALLMMLGWSRFIFDRVDDWIEAPRLILAK